MICEGIAPFTRATKIYIKDGEVQMIDMYGPELADNAEGESACGVVLEQLKSVYGQPPESVGPQDHKWVQSGKESYFTSRFPGHGCKLTLRDTGFRRKNC